MLISVVLPVYNAQNTISEAIDSILNQTFTDFELIIINDGSTDESEKIILEFNDQRIKYYANDGNKGLIYTLNRGIELSMGKYIARMDADDIALPKRFEKQVRVMEENPDIIVCGTQIKYFGISKRKSKFYAPETSKDNKEWLLENTCFAHPTVMMRRSVLIENNISYNCDYKHCEDYKLWIDLSNYGDFYNLQEVLLLYRLSYTQITQNGNIIQIQNSRRCRREYLKLLYGNDVILDKIDINLIRKCYKYRSKNKYIIELLYLSLEQYSLLNFVYYIFSFDWIRFKFITNLAIVKRFIKKRNSLL